MKNLIRQIIALCIALFVLFYAAACESKTEWRGVRDSAYPITCGRNAEGANVHTCVGGDGSVWTCVESGTHPDYRMTCAEQAAPPPAEGAR
jgi:hypothetical protein